MKNLADKFLKTVNDIWSNIWGTMHELAPSMAVKVLKTYVAGKALDPKQFKNAEVSALADLIVKDLSSGKMSIPDIAAHMRASPAWLDVSKLSWSPSLGDLKDKTKATQKVLQLMYIREELTAISAGLAIMGELMPTMELGLLGNEIRTLMRSTGLDQLTEMAMSQILGTIMIPPMQRELNPIFRPAILPADVALTAFRRGYTSAEYKTTVLGYAGYSDDDQKILESMSQFYPPGQDFVRFGVREVFNEPVAKAGGYDNDYPAAIEPYAAKAGMTPEVLHWYWRAHWEIPSPNMGYEMLHRRLITVDQLRGMLKIADYAPGYIDAMINIAYQPLTRVDARRMLQMGIISDAEFMLAMQDIGYDPKNCQRLLDFTKADQATTSKDLTQAVILQSYSLSLATRETVLGWLKDLGYDDSEAALLLAIEDRKAAQALIQEKVDIFSMKYTNGEMSRNEFIKLLNGLGIGEPKATIEAIKAEKAMKAVGKMPSKEDIMGWYKNKQITQAQTVDQLRRIGYLDDDINLYLGMKSSETIKTS
jgi:hypothetical protein